MEEFSNINIKLFKEDLLNNFINNISETTCITLSHMLSIDYVLRLKSKPVAEKHIDNCIEKLKLYLGSRVINDDSFSVALTLFAVAIGPITLDQPYEDNILEQSQDIIVESLTNIYFPDVVDPIEKNKIKLLLQSLLKGAKVKETIDYVYANTKLFCTSVMYAIKKYNKQEEVNTYIQKEINTVLKISQKFIKKNNAFKQLTSKITGAICALAVGAISVTTAGATFSIMVIPASIFAIKYAPRIGEKIGEFILKHDNLAKLAEQKINQLKYEIQNNNQSFLSKVKVKEHGKSKNNVINSSPTLSVLSKNYINNGQKQQR